MTILKKSAVDNYHFFQTHVLTYIRLKMQYCYWMFGDVIAKHDLDTWLLFHLLFSSVFLFVSRSINIQFLLNEKVCKGNDNSHFLAFMRSHNLKLFNKSLFVFYTGVILRDSHGVAQVRFVTGSKILRILKAKSLAPAIPEDLYHLVKKAVSIRRHLERNRKVLISCLSNI